MPSDSQVSEVRTAWKSEVSAAAPLAPRQVAVCLTLALAALAGPRALGLHSFRAYLWLAALTAAAAVALCVARDWNAAELGLTLRPRPAIRYWIAAGLWMSAAVLAAIAAALVLARRGFDPFGLCPAPVPPLTPLELSLTAAVHPVLEEALFRFVLCGALVGRVSQGTNVATSGFAFAVSHVVLGGIGPDSAVGGFLLAWAFLRGGSIAVPIALHALGNVGLAALYGGRVIDWLACGPVGQ